MGSTVQRQLLKKPAVQKREQEQQTETLQKQVGHAHPNSEINLNRSIINGDPVQAKLTMGSVGDKFEQEADETADKVMSKPMNGSFSGGADDEAPNVSKQAFLQKVEEDKEVDVSQKASEDEVSRKTFLQTVLYNEDKDVKNDTVNAREDDSIAQKNFLQTVLEDEGKDTPDDTISAREDDTVAQKNFLQTVLYDEDKDVRNDMVNAKEDEGAVQMMSEEPELATSEAEMVSTMAAEEQVNMKADSEETVQSKEDEESVQTEPEEDTVQSKGEEIQASKGSNSPGADFEQKLSNSKGGGSSMSPEVQSEMESGFGKDFSNVKIHTDSTAVEMNKDIGAKAFTNKNDIYFNSGQYDDQSTEGKKLLAHELTHTIQQGASGDAIQKKDNPTLSEDKSSSENNTKDFIKEEMGDDASLTKPPEVDPDQEKPDESDKDTGDVDKEKKQVMPDVDRPSDKKKDVEDKTESVVAESEKPPEGPGTEDKKAEEKGKEELSPKEKAALEAQNAFARAKAMKAPKPERSVKMPKLIVPKNAAGKPVVFNPVHQQQLSIFMKRVEILRQRGHLMRLKATEQKIAAEQLKGNIYLVFETIFENEEALAKQRGAQEERYGLLDQTKEFQKVAEERTRKSLEAQPSIEEDTTELYDVGTSMAEETEDVKNEQAQNSGKSDDSDVRESEKESSGQMGESASTGKDIGDNATNKKADSEAIAEQLPGAIANNQASQVSIDSTETQLQEIDGKVDEIEGINQAAVVRLNELLIQPETQLQEAEKLDKQAENLIKTSKKLEKEIFAAQHEYLVAMGAIPEEKSEGVQSKSEDETIQRTPEDGNEDVVVQKQDDDADGTADDLTPEELQIQQTESLFGGKLFKLLGKIEDNEKEADRTDGALGGVEEVLKSGYEDVANVPWAELPNMMKQEIENAINDPGRYFSETVDMVMGYFAPREKMPGETDFRYYVDRVAKGYMGLSIILGFAAAAFGAMLYLTPIIGTFFPPAAIPLWPLMPFFSSAMAFCGAWAVKLAIVSLLMRVFLIIHDVIGYAFASSAEEQAQWAAMIEDNVNGVWEPLMIVLPIKFFQKFKKPRKKPGGGDGADVDSPNQDKLDGNNKNNADGDGQNTTNESDPYDGGDQGDNRLENDSDRDLNDQLDEQQQIKNDETTDIESNREQRDMEDLENTPEGESLDNSDEIANMDEKQIDQEKDILKDNKELDNLNDAEVNDGVGDDIDGGNKSNENLDNVDDLDGGDGNNTNESVDNKDGSDGNRSDESSDKFENEDGADQNNTNQTDNPELDSINQNASELVENGTNINDLAEPPPGYEFYTRDGQRKIRRTPPKDGKVQLTTDSNGTIIESAGGSNRISVPGKLRSNLGDPPGPNHQAHHIASDNVVQNSPIHQEAMNRGLYDVDRASNGKYLSVDEASKIQGISDDWPTHSGSHPKWDKLVGDVNQEYLQKLLDKYGDIKNVPDDVLDKTTKAIEKRLLNELQNWDNPKLN